MTELNDKNDRYANNNSESSNVPEFRVLEENVYKPVIKATKSPWTLVINITLFILTFISTTMAGVFWLGQDPYDFSNFLIGVPYAILIMSILTAHEFGHYFAAKYHRVDVTLPFYIPFPFLFLNPFGTMGAVIKMRSHTQTRKSLFDIGIAGPISGFIVAVVILVYGFATLPPFEYIYTIHPEYELTGVPTSGFAFGRTLLYWALENIFSSTTDSFIPPMNEMYHYPFLCVGWFGLLITALNLLPVGQLDGGHITYALLGKKHKVVAWVFFGFVLFMGLLGLLPLLGFDVFVEYGLLNWLIWAVMMFFVIRVEHPPVNDPEPLGFGRQMLGLFALFMFLSSFTPVFITNF